MVDRLPLVRDANPLELLALAPAEKALQPYLPRDVDQELDEALSSPGTVLVVHRNFSGARRSVYEALLRNLPTLPLWKSNSVTAEESDAAPERAVLWMDLSLRHPVAHPVETSVKQWSGPGRYAIVLAKEDYPGLSKLTNVLEPRTIVLMGSTLSDSERAAARDLFGVDAPSIEELSSLDYTVRETSDRHAAGYHADTDTGDDQLGITADVHMLADVVASRFVKPPLSIGLFGNWGSGKSFFMRQMRARVRELADAAAQAEARTGQHGPAVSSYCSNVRQITFNAWHYVEANLWASLATHIFDNLATDGSEETLRRRADELAEMREQEQSLLKQLSMVRLERMLRAAQPERRVPLDLTGEDFAWVAQELGVPKATTEDVRQFATELRGLGVETRRVWTLLRRSRFALVMCGIGVVLAVGLAVLVRSPAWPVLAGVVSLLVGVTPVVSRVREAASRIRRAAENATDQRLTELDEETARLERAVTELATDVTTFARSRHASEDYRQHLGVVSLLRRDLETFAAILDKERDGGLERIVLYIDDLDRCPPDVVIKVLEAVHLLVALPVFVVVVAVDPRWLHQAIRHHYAAMLPGGSVTPIDYLEKIFQIPFRLCPMDERGFDKLVHALSGARTSGPFVTVESGKPLVSQGDWVDLLEPEQEKEPEPSPKPVTRLALRPRQLNIWPAELAFIAELAPFVPTPRSAKRLVNLYRLVRARLSDSELDDFVDSGDFRAVAVLLATGGKPAPEILDLPETYEQWLPLVRRFSFGQRGTAPGDADGGRS